MVKFRLVARTGRPRSPIRPEQMAELEAIRSGDISRRRLVAANRWYWHRGFHAAYMEALQQLEERWQDQLLTLGTEADIARYVALLATAGTIQRLRFLRGAIWRAQHAAELAAKRRKLPSWRQVQQTVFAETGGLLRL